MFCRLPPCPRELGIISSHYPTMPTKFCETVTFCFFLHIACVLKSYVASTPIARDEDTSDTYCSIGSTEQHGSTTNVTFAEIMKVCLASLAYGHELYNVQRERFYRVPMTTRTIVSSSSVSSLSLSYNFFFSSLLSVISTSFVTMMSTSSHHP